LFKTALLTIKLFFLALIFHNQMHAQSCKVPFSINFSEKTTTSIKIKWFDSNTSPLGWEIEIVKKGKIRTGVPSSPLITTKEFLVENLEPSTAYELYIRTVCTSTSQSAWNVAIPFTTVLEIPTQCSINIPLKDNGTETLLLDVKEKGILGKDIFLDAVEIIAEHTWPADLKITLESPQGQQIVLSNHNGTITDNFGDISDNTCSKPTIFSPNACQLLKDHKPPYIGTFKTDGSIQSWKPDTLTNGYWKLIFFDRAVKDVGTLRFVDLKFNKIECLAPVDFSVIKADVNALTVAWKSNNQCNTARITYKSKTTQKTIHLECGLQTFKIENLLPNESYELTISSACSLSSESMESCPIVASTTCEPVSMSEHFDGYDLCTPGCGTACQTLKNYWTNITEDGKQDWLVNKDHTETENTGPASDVSKTGKYMYIENNPSICDTNQSIVLQSKCMDVKSNPSGCDMSFYYHMYGTDINLLKLEISTDNGLNWNTLHSISGNQGDEWKRTTIALKNYADRSALFRFVAKSASGPLGDIAIDNIEFYGSKPSSGLYTYYKDEDKDGFGIENGRLETCMNLAPTGYVTKAGDCDDKNGKIFPGAKELQCNGVDENCNGLTDDQPTFNPMTYQAQIENASCNGSTDGQINLSVNGGNGPYQITWNNNANGTNIQALKAGIYYATIVDQGGCVLNTDFFEIKSKTTLNIVNTEKTDVSCLGKSDASIFIEHTLGNGPYKYQWSNGSTGKNLINVAQGNYNVTVTDNRQCSAVLPDISVLAKPSVTTDIKEIKHPLCFGQNTGEVSLLTTNGNPPYTYLWNNGQTTDILKNLSANSYTCTVTDKSGCQNIKKVTITQPPKITGKILTTENVRCHGENNGSIKTDVEGGVSPYTFLWNNLDITDDIFGIKAGLYMLTVTDANGCKYTYPTIEIKQPVLFEAEIDSVKAASCLLGTNGYVHIMTKGGNGLDNFAWSHTSESRAEFGNLKTGNYNVTAYDKLGCKSVIPNIFIPYKNESVQVQIGVLRENDCYNQKNGVIYVKNDSKYPPYDYNWSYGLQYFKSSATDTVKNLPSGQYTVTVTDNQGCTGAATAVRLIERPPFYYSVKSIQNNLCQGDSSGRISIDITGGEPPYGILWNGGLLAGKEIIKLPSQKYSGIISDNKGCILEISPIIIQSESDIKWNAVITNDTNFMSKGKICLNPSGGISPYKFLWSKDGMTSACIENLKVGTYLVTITDQSNCVLKSSFTIDNVSSTEDKDKLSITISPNPAVDFLNIKSDLPVSEISITSLSGHLMEHIYQINDSTVRCNVINLPPGLYFLRIQMSNGNTRTIKFVKV
jgi:subtilisin-like proprotein convertase family protein